eukprot:CAMPEP_0173452270 /NCGR_PEP_ID=MMETSP1357-20121228/48382_1 /TAXON_ID=77926 /ORGANISM="Hemiselmis rufescens, Strain PCC563" /LENGTH=81 /DNA_ID=CAMNT_0014419123 /DNA_START=118 /DNA_END=360 /DNA_ORIENTATION=+
MACVSEELKCQIPSLYSLCARSISSNLSLHQDFSLIPSPAAHSILRAAHASGQLSLSALLKFAHSPLTDLDLTSCGVDEEW